MLTGQRPDTSLPDNSRRLVDPQLGTFGHPVATTKAANPMD